MGVRVFVASSRTHPYSVGSKDGELAQGPTSILPLGNVYMELFSGHLSNRDDLKTAHDEALCYNRVSGA